LDEARAEAKSAADAALDGLRRQRHDLRDEVAEFASSTKASFRDEDTRNTLLIGLAGVAVSAAVGIACQKRIAETIDG